MILRLLQRAGWITAGNIVGQAAVLLATLWLARMYAPAEFGLFAIVLVISNISVALAGLRFDVAIPAASDEDAPGLVVTAMGSVVISAVLATAALWVADRAGWVALPLIETKAALVFATILTSGAFQTLTACLVREERFRMVGVLRALQGLSFVLFASLPFVGLLWAQSMSLIWGLLLAPAAFRTARGMTPRHLIEILRRQWKLPIFSLPGAALDVIGYSMVIWVLIGIYGAADAGTYSQLQRLVGGPLMLVSISLGQVMLRQTVDHLGDPPALKTLLSRVLLGLAGLVVLAVVAVAAVGTPVLRLVLGEQWVIAPMMVVLITVAVGVRACVSPLSSALISLRRFDIGLIWQALYFTSAVLLFPWMASRLSFHEFVAFYAVHEAVLYTLYLALIWRAVSRSEVR